MSPYRGPAPTRHSSSRRAIGTPARIPPLHAALYTGCADKLYGFDTNSLASSRGRTGATNASSSAEIGPCAGVNGISHNGARAVHICIYVYIYICLAFLPDTLSILLVHSSSINKDETVSRAKRKEQTLVSIYILIRYLVIFNGRARRTRSVAQTSSKNCSRLVDTLLELHRIGSRV